MASSAPGRQWATQAPRRNGKPYPGGENSPRSLVSPRPSIKRSSSLFGSLKNIVSAPLTWLSGKDTTDLGDEDAYTDEAATGQKRRALKPKEKDTEMPRATKKIRRQSPDRAENTTPRAVARGPRRLLRITDHSSNASRSPPPVIASIPDTGSERSYSPQPAGVENDSSSRGSFSSHYSGLNYGNSVPRPSVVESDNFGIVSRSPFRRGSSQLSQNCDPARRSSSFAPTMSPAGTPSRTFHGQSEIDPLPRSHSVLVPMIEQQLRTSSPVPSSIPARLQAQSRSISREPSHLQHQAFAPSPLTAMPLYGRSQTAASSSAASTSGFNRHEEIHHSSTPRSGFSAKFASTSKPRPLNPEHSASERILAALEQAQPWSEATKLRREQRSKIRVPIPANQSGGMSGRLERMIRPYGRRPGVGKTDQDEPAKESDKVGLLSRLAQKKDTPLKNVVPSLQEDAEDQMDTDKEPTEEAKATETPQPLPDISIEASVKPSIPPASKVSDVSTSAKAPVFEVRTSTTAPKGSSLRAARASKRVHESSATLSNNKKQAGRFAADSDDEEDDGMLGQDELKAWASKNTISVEIPLGWKFGDAKADQQEKAPEPIVSTQAPPPTSTLVSGGKPRLQGVTPLAPPPTSSVASIPTGTSTSTASSSLPFKLAPPVTSSSGTGDKAQPTGLSAPGFWFGQTKTNTSTGFGTPATSQPFGTPAKSTTPSFPARSTTAEAKPSPFSLPTPSQPSSSGFSLAPPIGGRATPSLFAGFGGVPSTKKPESSEPTDKTSKISPQTSQSEPAKSEAKSTETAPSKPAFTGFGGFGSIGTASTPAFFGSATNAPTSIFGNKTSETPAASDPKKVTSTDATLATPATIDTNASVTAPAPKLEPAAEQQPKAAVPTTSTGFGAIKSPFSFPSTGSTTSSSPFSFPSTSTPSPFASIAPSAAAPAKAVEPPKTTLNVFAASFTPKPTETQPDSTSVKEASATPATTDVAKQPQQTTASPFTFPKPSDTPQVAADPAAPPKSTPIFQFGSNTETKPTETKPTPTFTFGSSAPQPSSTPFTFGSAKPSPFSFGTSTTSSTPTPTITAPAPSAPAVPNPFASTSRATSQPPPVFGSAPNSPNPFAPASVPGTPQASATPLSTPFTFGAQLAPSSGSTSTSNNLTGLFGKSSNPISFGVTPQRPKTPPNNGNGMDMETSPQRTVAAPTQAAAPSAPSLSFNFGANTSTAPAFGGFGSAPVNNPFAAATNPTSSPFGTPALPQSSLPPTPSSPFAPPSSFAGTPSPFQAPLPPPAFGAPALSAVPNPFGSGPSSANPVTPTSAQGQAFSFNFSGAPAPAPAPPATTPTQPGGFVFGIGVAPPSGSTPTSTSGPSKSRQIKGMPNRRGGRR